MHSADKQPIAVIYNGACPICAREIGHYRELAKRAGAAISFTDLTCSDLSAHNLSPDAAARRLHVAQGGRLVSGIDAFLLLWARLPGFRWAARAARLPVLRAVLDVAYNRIAAPWLYRRHLRRSARA